MRRAPDAVTRTPILSLDSDVVANTPYSTHPANSRVSLDLTSLKFLGKMLLVVPLLAALAAHLAEPGLLTKDKSKDQ